MAYGEVVSQWVIGDSFDLVPELFTLFGDRVTITDVTKEPVSTLEDDPNFVINGVETTTEIWGEIDDHPKTEVLYYG